MIKCTNNDKPRMLEYLYKNPSENCFFIGDAENFNFDEDFIDFWRPEGSSPPEYLLMRFYGYYHISALNDAGFKDMAEIIKDDPKALSLNGLRANIEKMGKFIPLIDSKKSYLAELSKETFKNFTNPYSPQKASESEIDELFDFQKSIKEFNMDEGHRKSFGNEIRTGTGRTYFIRERGRIVSSATITAENSCNGMMIGVATADEFRNRGYAKACVSKLQ